MRTLNDALLSMYHHAEHTMTADELKSLSDAFIDTAVSMSQGMSEILEDVGCMVSYEKTNQQEHNGFVSGCLRDPEDVASLLFLVASKFDLLAGLVEVGSEANFTANQKKKALETKANFNLV